MGRLSGSTAILGVAGLLIVGGGGYALAASAGGGTITVCVTRSDGTLYKARKCAKHDHKLSWNAQGRQGPQGPQGSLGPQGIHGIQGPPGISTLYMTHGSDQTLTADNTTRPVVTMSVPAGTYEVRFTLEATASAGSFVGCSITGGTTEEGAGLAQFQPSGSGNYASTIHVDDVVQGVSSISGACRNLYGQANVYSITLIAIPIVDLHVQ
jgi:hypothetical protein